MLIDGRLRGQTDADGLGVFDCSPGTHEVIAKIDQRTSLPLTIDLPPGCQAEVTF